MKKTNKKGFTIVELVIVIAVIAILAAVLIPTFSAIVKKANLSADQQAVRQMNTVLSAEEITNDKNVFVAFDSLAEAGLDAKDYKTLSTGMAFFWDAEINRVLLVENDVAIYPEEYKNRTNNGKWFSLTQEIQTEKVEISSGVATVEKAEQLAFVLEEVNKSASSVKSIALSEDVDMKGSTFTVNKVSKNNALEISGGTIKNATAVEAKQVTTSGKITSGNDGIYNMAMITKVEKGATVTLKNLTIENMNMKDTNAGNCGLLVGTLSGKLILENVTIKDSSIIGYTSVGALVGYMTSTGSIEIRGTLTINNVKIQGVGGRIGQLIGYADNTITDKITVAAGASVSVINVTNTIYSCEQNTGSCKATGCSHGTLGLDNGIIHSWALEGNGTIGCEKKDNRAFNANSLVGYATAKAGTDYNVTLKNILGL